MTNSARQSGAENWIASELTLLAMTNEIYGSGNEITDDF
jgi:hypothetical protein